MGIVEFTGLGAPNCSSIEKELREKIRERDAEITRLHRLARPSVSETTQRLIDLLLVERVGEESVVLGDVYADVQAQIRDNHEKLISGELTPDSAVEHPKHYNSHPSGVECVTIAQHHTFCIGNVLKYLWRAGLKGEATELEDLRKARQYLDFEIERIEQSEV